MCFLSFTIVKEKRQPKECQIEVVKTKQKGGSEGRYFFFQKGMVKKLKIKTKYIVQLRNKRTKRDGKAYIWGGDDYFGSTYYGHGRFQTNEAGQFNVGDKIIILDKSFCIW